MWGGSLNRHPGEALSREVTVSAVGARGITVWNTEEEIASVYLMNICWTECVRNLQWHNWHRWEFKLSRQRIWRRLSSEVLYRVVRGSIIATSHWWLRQWAPLQRRSMSVWLHGALFLVLGIRLINDVLNTVLQTHCVSCPTFSQLFVIIHKAPVNEFPTSKRYIFSYRDSQTVLDTVVARRLQRRAKFSLKSPSLC